VEFVTESLARLNLRTGLSLMSPSLVAEQSAEPVSNLVQDISLKEFPMRVIFETARLFALVAVLGLMAASSGCAKPEGGDGASTPPADLGAEAGSTTGGGAEVPEGGEEAPAEGEGEAPAETEAPAEGEPAAPAEGEAPAEAEAPAEGE
jgi:hypothetical protein